MVEPVIDLTQGGSDDDEQDTGLEARNERIKLNLLLLLFDGRAIDWFIIETLREAALSQFHAPRNWVVDGFPSLKVC